MRTHLASDVERVRLELGEQLEPVEEEVVVIQRCLRVIGVVVLGVVGVGETLIHTHTHTRTHTHTHKTRTTKRRLSGNEDGQREGERERERNKEKE